MARETQRYEITVAPAKGRPMLQWAGKRALDRVIAYPSQQIERHGNDGLDKKGSDWADWPANYPYGGLIFHGDNKEVLAHLLAEGFRGKVKCVYIDPPFDSGADYVRRITLRGPSASPRVDGESYSLGEQVQYTDIWANDSYLQFMYERLILIRELLTQDGVLWLHADPTRGHYLKCILDEIFGQEHFINQVVWKRSDAHGNVGQGARHLGTVHDMLLLYSRGDDYYWNPLFDELPETTVSKWYRHVEEGTGRRYNLADMTGPGGSAKGNPVYEWNGVTRAWRYSRTRMDQLDREGRIEYSASGMAYQKRYLDESKGVPLQDWWDDISMIRGIQRRNSSLYPT